MTGLDKIIEEIKSEASANADVILKSADNDAAKIIADAKKEANEKSDEILKNAEKKKEDILSRGESSANLEKQKSLLVAKQTVINNMLSASLEKMENAEDKQYFSYIIKLIEKNSQNTDGFIAFNSKDLNRLPENFVSEINAVSKGKLVISNTPVNIKSGFILIYGGIEENCSFDAIFRSKHEELTDEISALLFS